MTPPVPPTGDLPCNVTAPGPSRPAGVESRTMDRCRHCQAQLLDHLYDLLDEADQAVLEAHLSGCVACRHALDLARQQQQMLAAAARYDGVVAPYHAPAVVPLGEPLEQPAVLPLPYRKPAAGWRPWVAAAAALLVLAGVGLWVRHDHAAARDAVAANRHDRAERAAELASLQKRQDEVETHRGRELERLAQRATRDELTVQATGPQVLAGKLTAPFRVETRDAWGEAVAADVRAELRTAAGDETPALVRATGDGKSFRVESLTDLPPGEYKLLVHAERPGGAPVTLPVPVEVAAADPVTYLTTDRPLYQAGKDVVHYRSLTLDRRTLEPYGEGLDLEYVLRAPDGREEVVARGPDRLREAESKEALVRGPDGLALRGVGAGAFALSAGQSAGEYSLVVRERAGRFPETRTRFLVARPTNLRLDAGPLWGKAVYRPGEAIDVSGRLVRATGEPLRGKAVAVRLVVDGREQPAGQVVATDAEGKLHVLGRVPAQATTAAVLLRVQDGATVEEVQAPVPLFLAGAAVEFFPEGGDLVAGLEGRVYFQARDRRGRPIALEGVLLEDDKPTTVQVQTAEVPEVGAASGLGRFAFTPKAGASYRVRVDKPAGVGQFTLPPVRPDGVVLTLADPVVEAGQALTVRVASTTNRPVRVALSCRGEVLDVQALPTGQGAVTFATTAARGVCRVTAYEEQTVLGHDAPGPLLAAGLALRADGPFAAATLLLAGSWDHLEMVPRAERLAFGRPRERLDLEARTERAAQNGALAKVTLQAKDELRRAVPAVAQVGVVDQLALAEADDRFTRSLPAHAWLAAELPSPDLLERADALLLPASASRQALDLVLATQGWRRFDGAGESGDADRLVTVQGRRMPDYPALARERAALLKTTGEQRAVLADRQAEARAALDALADDPAAATAALRLAWYEGQGPRLRQGFLLALGGLLVLVLVVALVRLARAELERARPYLGLAGATAAVLVVALVTPGLARLDGEPAVAALVEKAPGHRELAANAPAGPARAPGVWLVDPLRDFAEKEDRNLRGGGSGRATPERGVGTVADAPGRPAHAALERKQDAGPKARAPTEALEPNKAVPAAPPATSAMTLVRPGADKAGDDAADRFRRLVEEEGKEEGAKLAQQALQSGGPSDEAEQARRKRPLVVRAFANLRDRAGDAGRGRPPVVFWHPVLVLPGAGATVEFQLGGPAAQYRLDVQAHSLDGRLGTLRQELSEK